LLKYDVIVVGARCAGASTAMLASRRGLRVLLVDKDHFPCDALGTHFMHPRGSAYLMRWGLWQAVLQSNAPVWDRHTMDREAIGPFVGATPLSALRERFREVHAVDLDEDAVVKYCAPRRKVLDHILVRAAVDAGADLCEQVTVDRLLRDGQRVVGIRGTSRGGTPFEARAAVVVGADGRHSRVAQEVSAGKSRERPRCTFCYWSYWEGLPVGEGAAGSSVLSSRGRLGTAAFPTNDGLTEVLVMGPCEWYPSFKTNVTRNFHTVVEFCAPSMERALREARQVERTYGTVDQPQRFHVSHGPGWALVGDAGYNKDQCTAIGMTHAFRDAELLASAILAGLGGEATSPDAALSEYEAERDRDALDYYDFVCDRAESNPPQLAELRLLEAIRGRDVVISELMGVVGDAVHVRDFFGNGRSLALVAEARRDLPSPEIFHDFDAKVAAYAVAPW
jgi:flavin-dependent dehydrogenase